MMIPLMWIFCQIPGFTTAWLDLNTTLPCYCKGLSTKPAQRELQLPLIPPVLGKHAKHLGLSRREPYYSWSIILPVLYGTFRRNTPRRKKGGNRVKKEGIGQEAKLMWNDRASRVEVKER